MYKYGIPLFRSIFTLLRILPSWRLARRLRRRVGGNRNGNFSILLRVDGVESSIHRNDILDFGESSITCPRTYPVSYAQSQWYHTVAPTTHFFRTSPLLSFHHSGPAYTSH